MKSGDLVRIREYSGHDIFIVIRRAEKYAIPVYIVQSNLTGQIFKMTAEALLPLEGVV